MEHRSTFLSTHDAHVAETNSKIMIASILVSQARISQNVTLYNLCIRHPSLETLTEPHKFQILKRRSMTRLHAELALFPEGGLKKIADRTNIVRCKVSSLTYGIFSFYEDWRRSQGRF